VIVPADGDDEATDRVEDLAALTGARPVRMPAAKHDSVVAAISHLPLVLAASLVESVAGGAAGAAPEWPAVAALAATGWRDSTRLARGDVAMGASIAATNAPALAERVRAVIDVLEQWLVMLERPAGPDEQALADRLRTARDRLAEADV
jgi:prephenate dehydrogenase